MSELENFAPIKGSPQKAIVLACDAGYAPYVPVLIQSVLDNARRPQNYDLIIMDCGAGGDSSIFQRLFAEIEDMLAAQNNKPDAPHFFLRIMNMGDILAGNKFITENKEAFARYGYATYARLFIPQMLAAYKQALYLDIDQIVLGDIADLFDIMPEKSLIAAVPDISVAMMFSEGKKLQRQKPRMKFIRKELGLSNKDFYIIAAPILFNISACCAFNLTEKLLHFLAKNTDMVYPDQDAVNAVCKGRICYLPQKWGRVNAGLFDKMRRIIISAGGEGAALFAEKAEPLLIHYTSLPKPWRGANTDYAGLWWRYAMRTPDRLNLLFAPESPFALPGEDKNFSRTYKLFGIPLWTVKARRQERCYYLGKLPLIWRKRGKENNYIYFLGIKIISYPV